MGSRFKTNSHYAENQSGQALVEFVLSMTFLTLLILSILELFGLLYTYNVVADAAKEGVRYAIVHGVDSSNSSGPTTHQTATTPPCTSSNQTSPTTLTQNVRTQVQNFAGLSLHDMSTMNVYVCYFDGNNNLTSQVEVAVSYPFRPFFHLSWPSVTINANSEGRIVF
jgi:Flp pilus assembly protein TadG